MARIRRMLLRQEHRCCLEGWIKECPGGRLPIAEATFDHQDGRKFFSGHRDDRTEKMNPKTGETKPYNGAAHYLCSIKKGERRIDYTHFYDV
jgi:hypothetical protein